MAIPPPAHRVLPPITQRLYIELSPGTNGTHTTLTVSCSYTLVSPAATRESRSRLFSSLPPRGSVQVRITDRALSATRSQSPLIIGHWPGCVHHYSLHLFSMTTPVPLHTTVTVSLCSSHPCT